MKKKVLVIAGILILVIFFIFLFGKSAKTGTIIQNIEVVPLSEGERQLVAGAVLSSEFVKDIPEKYPIAITFFDFENGERRWRDGFLINNHGFLSDGQPEVFLSLHAKYIPELEKGDLCGIIQKAKNSGDLDFYSDSSKASLFIKYVGMLKHRDCFGI